MGHSIDREKVIKAIKGCINDGSFCNKCDYDGCVFQHGSCEKDLLADALALLKEQEAKTGHWVSVNDGDVVAIDDDGFPERACFCSECKKYLIASDEYTVYGKYCPFCGAKMEGSVK